VWDWDVSRHEVRAMTSFATTAEDVETFAAGVTTIAARHL
jgi:threonine aldolase